jgi:hypothetical protein
MRMRIRDPETIEPGSDRENSDPGSGINIPDPQHWFVSRYPTLPYVSPVPFVSDSGSPYIWAILYLTSAMLFCLDFSHNRYIPVRPPGLVNSDPVAAERILNFYSDESGSGS